MALVLLLGNEWTVRHTRDWVAELSGGDGPWALLGAVAHLTVDGLTWPRWQLAPEAYLSGPWLVETLRVVLFVLVAGALLRRVTGGPYRALGVLGAVPAAAVLATVATTVAHTLLGTGDHLAVESVQYGYVALSRAVVGGFVIGVVLAWAGADRSLPIPTRSPGPPDGSPTVGWWR
ncbi:hypothetical protein [Micromonospora echinospora]|uniref:hypothetical protein n=1 Tax=Micromonospora echinospora TaxID=1877 RepID=UPI00366BF4FA